MSAEPARNAGPKPAIVMIEPMTTGPRTPARLKALELNASSVPRRRSECAATIACIAGTPNQVPDAHRPSASSDSGGGCGNGVVDPGEICDDGNQYSDDGCSATCSIDNYPPVGPACGDGTLDKDEECDDGNLEDGDGCTMTCDFEA